MRKDFQFSGDMKLNAVRDTDDNIISDFGRDIASADGTDLNIADRRKNILAKSEVNNTYMNKDISWRERLGASIGALSAMASPIHSQYAQMENMNGNDVLVDYAIVQEYYNPNQQIDNEVAQFAQLREMENRERNREALDLNSALNEPQSSDNCDPPPSESIDMPQDNLNTEDE
jgi:hypothetical protein